ncbi:hypothetical protein HAX54_015175 [Datura stramonium]|uniref:BHLH domain-containing protein n=1 Tax=Datura stramonium TaxID=4076 RepID=A0ABS8Y2N4_DATST|nr:hypothetical protein [Datura stramonium]
MGCNNRDEKFKDSENPKKKSRVSRIMDKNKKSGQAKSQKNQKNIKINNEEAGEKERNNNAAENSKQRSQQRAATDPQSLYARKRRERINERLRILQSLVPNGTKVDISTMLEEAVHYVNFCSYKLIAEFR